MRILSCFILLALLSSPAWGQEIFVQAGSTESTDNHHPAPRWGLAYQQGLSEHVAVGLTYINEGHIPNHHRDGYEPQIWFRANVIERRLSLAAGIGPYLYFDTTSARPGPGSYDSHGWGAVASLAATWYTDSRLLYQIRANYIEAINSFNSVSVTVGLGYQLDAPAKEGPLEKAPKETENTTLRQISAFAGDAVLNRFQSRHSVAEAIEYRTGIVPHLDVSFGLLNEEGPSRGDDRYGVMGQAWAVRSFLKDRLTFGVGAGPYLARDENRGTGGSTTLNAIIGLTAALNFSDHWVGRFIWDRVLTNYSHDADVFLVGLGYRF